MQQELNTDIKLKLKSIVTDSFPVVIIWRFKDPSCTNEINICLVDYRIYLIK